MLGRKTIHTLEFFGVKTAEFAGLDAIGPALVVPLAGGAGLADDVLEAGDGGSTFGGDGRPNRTVDSTGEGEHAFCVAGGEGGGPNVSV